MRFAIAFLASFNAIIWLGLLGAGLGFFHAPSIIIAGSVCGLLVFFNLRGYFAGRIDKFDDLAVLLALTSMLLALPPAELILGGWDPGVYLHTGMEIVRTKALQFDHVDLINMPAEDKGLLMRDLHGIREPFGGMRILENGKVSPQFYHAYPALMAVIMAFGGLWGGLLLNPVLHAGSILVFYALLVSITEHRKWALLGALLLAANPTQLWMAKFCTAEMLTQFLLLSGLALLHHTYSRTAPQPLILAMGGAALGLAQLTRYDTLIFLAAFIPVLVLATRRNHTERLTITFGMIGLAIVHAWFHQRWIAPYYQPLGPSVTKGLIICAAATLSLALIKFCRLGNTVITPTIRNLAMGVFSACWLGWMSFNWFFRPTLHMRINAVEKLQSLLSGFNAEFIMSTLIGPTSQAMLYLQSIFGMATLGFALLGVLVWLWQRKDAVQQAWFWAGMGATLLLTWNPFNDLFMMWVSRRYLPVVIPWLIMATIWGGVWLSSTAKKHLPFPRLFWAPPFMILASVMLVMPASSFLARERDWPGLIAWFEHVQASVPAHSIIYTDQPGFAAPLRFIWGHRAYELHHANEERKVMFYELLERAAGRGKTIYLLTLNPIPRWLISNVQVDTVAQFRLGSHILKNNRVSTPDATQGRSGDFVLYKLEHDMGSQTP